MGDLWLYEWPNGQASIVYAEDEQGVVQLLDELGSADEALVQPYDGDFFVTFTPTLNPETKEPEWQADPYDHAEDIFEVVLEDPEAAILKYGEGTVDKTASLAGSPDDEGDDPSEIVKDLASQFRDLADKATDGDKRILWLDAARGMDAAAEALDNLKLAGAE